MELKHKLEGYKNITLELIRTLEKEEFDLIEQLIDKRQACLEEINTLDYSKEEFKDVCHYLNLLKLQEKLDVLIKEKQRETKEKINEIIYEKSANRAYNRKFYENSRFLNKKI